MRSPKQLEHLRILNLGSGIRPFSDAVNLDITTDADPDVQHDLTQFPWPFPDNRFDELRAIDVFEHLPDLVATMEEVHRICRSRAVVKIALPHFSAANSYTDPTHFHHLGIRSFDYFCHAHEHDYYTRAEFLIQRRRIRFYRRPHDRVIERLANRWPTVYERRFAWMLPAWFLEFELIVVK